MLQEPSTVYLNGQYISSDIASISPDDRGFYFADGVYEVIKYYKSTPFYFDEHLKRLDSSLKALQIEYDGINKIRNICKALIEANNFKHKNAGVYIQITRGVSARSHRFPASKVTPTIYAKAFLMPSFLKEMNEGVRVMTREDIRWLRCQIKSISLLPNTLLFEDVASLGAFECMLIRNDNVTEASHSNLLAVKDGVVHTHPDSNLVLPGITKMAVLNICRNLSIPVVEEPIGQSEIYSFDEWFLTGTGSEIIPVVQVNNKAIGNGIPGPVTRRIQKEFFKISYLALAGENVEVTF